MWARNCAIQNFASEPIDDKKDLFFSSSTQWKQQRKKTNNKRDTQTNKQTKSEIFMTNFNGSECKWMSVDRKV